MFLNNSTVFNYKTHRENFMDYLEVVILKDGTIEYAVPSHQQKLIDLYCENHGINNSELWNMIPITESPVDWIIYNEGIISVWYSFILRPKTITEEQENALEKLVMEKCIYEKYKSYEVIKNAAGNLTGKEITNGGC